MAEAPEVGSELALDRFEIRAFPAVVDTTLLEGVGCFVMCIFVSHDYDMVMVLSARSPGPKPAAFFENAP